jgi:aryl-alcohol dehydrogenase-like predicted oxidoreductase
MEYRTLGQSGLKVSPLCFGAMTFGEPNDKSFMHKLGCDEATSHRLLDQGLEGGINFIDTADVYGEDGLSERVIGTWFDKVKKRNDVVLATKVRFRMGPGPNGTGASRYRIMRAAEDSLRRLKTDRIDLYQIHMQDSDTPEEETLRALDDLVRQGKVLYLGASNYAAYRLVGSLWTSKTERLSRFVSLQMQYSLVSREIEREHVPVCRDYGLGILPWSPLAGGFLSGKYSRDAAMNEDTRLGKQASAWIDLKCEKNWRVLDCLRAVAEEMNATPASVALAWLMQRPHVTSVIFGARTSEQLDGNLAAAKLTLSPADVGKLDAASQLELGYPYAFIQRVASRW